MRRVAALMILFSDPVSTGKTNRFMMISNVSCKVIATRAYHYQSNKDEVDLKLSKTDYDMDHVR